MDEEEDPIDEEQLDEYREMVDDLGAFPVSLKNADRMMFGFGDHSEKLHCSKHFQQN